MTRFTLQRGWTNRYVGLPFNEGGADQAHVAAYNCWELCRLALALEFGVEVDSKAGQYRNYRDKAASGRLIAEGLPGWVKVADGPEARAQRKQAGHGPELVGDLVVFEGAQNDHIGLVAAPGQMLSTEEGCGSHLAKIYGLRWSAALSGIYRHASQM